MAIERSSGISRALDCLGVKKKKKRKKNGSSPHQPTCYKSESSVKGSTWWRVVSSSGRNCTVPPFVVLFACLVGSE